MMNCEIWQDRVGWRFVQERERKREAHFSCISFLLLIFPSLIPPPTLHFVHPLSQGVYSHHLVYSLNDSGKKQEKGKGGIPNTLLAHPPPQSVGFGEPSSWFGKGFESVSKTMPHFLTAVPPKLSSSIAHSEMPFPWETE